MSRLTPSQVLNVYKPRGMTRYGRRKQHEQREQRERREQRQQDAQGAAQVL